MKKTFCIFLFTIVAIWGQPTGSGTVFKISYNTDDKYTLRIRENYKIYINNRYVGLKSREMKGILQVDRIPAGSEGENRYSVSGKVYNMTKTIRGYSTIGYKLDTIEDSSFRLDELGNIFHTGGIPFPPLQGIPVFPASPLAPDDIFSGSGSVLIDFYNSPVIEEIPVLYNSQYLGKRDFFGTEYDYFEITYVFDSNYSSDTLLKVRGKHNIRFFFDSTEGKPVFMEDKFEDYFQYSSGDSMKRKGFTLYFFKPIVRMNKPQVIEDIKQTIKEDTLIITDDIDFVKKEEGISLTINNLRFKPNSTLLLEGEEAKLQKIAAILASIEGRSFLIIGHTADIGEADAQLTLSIERAQAIALYLAAQGIAPERIMYTGRGAAEPVAPNDTPENRQKNRRVEIIILED